MILLELRQYLQAKTTVSMKELVDHFKMNPEFLRDMLAKFQNKNQLSKYCKTSACGQKCTLCDPLTTELYSWIPRTSRGT